MFNYSDIVENYTSCLYKYISHIKENRGKRTKNKKQKAKRGFGKSSLNRIIDSKVKQVKFFPSRFFRQFNRMSFNQ